MKKLIGLIIMILILSACDENKTNFQREASIYYGSELYKTEIFNRTVSKNDDLLIYKYFSQQDSSKVITIRYDKSLNKLISLTDKFVINKDKKIKNQILKNCMNENVWQHLV